MMSSRRLPALLRIGGALATFLVATVIVGTALAQQLPAGYGERVATLEFELHADNSNPSGIAIDDTNTYAYVVDRTDRYVYVYRLSDGVRQNGREFSIIGRAVGIDLDATYAYLVSDPQLTDSVHVYRLSDGELQGDLGFSTAQSNQNSTGIAIDSTYVYVMDADNTLYVYTRSDGERQHDLGFTSSVDNPTGITLGTTYMYIVENDFFFNTVDRVYVYALADLSRQSSRDLLLPVGHSAAGIAVNSSAFAYVVGPGNLYVFRLAEAPSRPADPTLVAGDGQISVSWSAPADGGSPITDYDVRYRSGTGAWTDHTHVGTARTATISSLANGSSYDVQVRAESLAGEGDWSPSSSATPRTVPDAPAAPTLTPSDRQIEVAWDAPDDGGAAITDYDVRVRAGTSGPWTDRTHLGTSRTVTIGLFFITLSNGTSYEVQVRAENVAGEGDWSPSASATPRTVPGAPAAPTLTPGDGTLSVSWDAPGDRGAAITDYDVRYRTSGSWTDHTHVGTARTATISGLSNGTSYEVQVRAENVAGEGDWSPSASATPQTAPDMAAAPTLTPSDGQIEVAWDAPDDRGAPITDYDVRYRSGTGAWTDHTHVGTARTATISSLANGTSYEVQVRAENSEGEGDWSPSASATPRTVPDAPAAPTLTPGDGQIAVSWDAPDDGGAAITDYDVRIRTSGSWTDHTHVGTGTTATISGLSNGTSYEVQVRAENAEGEGDWSPSSSATPVIPTVRTAPAAPGRPTLTAGIRLLEVEWVPPANGGAAITGYDVRYRSTLGEEWASEDAPGPSHDILGLVPGQAYEVQVRAENAVGAGPWSYSEVAAPRTEGSVAALEFPLITFLRTPAVLVVSYSADPHSTDTIEVSGDEMFSLSPDCDQNSASFSPPPATVPIYPCAAGTGSISVLVQGDLITWVLSSQVIEPRFSYTVNITSQASTTLSDPTVLWRSLSWPLYRDGLVDEGTVVVVDDQAHPLHYQEPGAVVDAVTVLVCSLDDIQCTATDATLWSTPPAVGDAVHFLSDVPFDLVYITMQQEGQRETPWVLDWDYGTETGWEPLPRPQDGTEGLSVSGTVLWDQPTARPMAPRVVPPLGNAMYVVRATLASAGSGPYTQPVISTAGAQPGMWSAVLQADLAPGAATALQVYVLPLDTVAAGDFRRAGPARSLLLSPPAVTTEAGPWRRWSPPAPPQQLRDSGADVSPPAGIARPIDSEGGGLPFIGFAVNRASTAAAVPTILLWTMIGMAAAFAALVLTQRAVGNIMISVIAGGLVLAALMTPSIGLSSVWVLMVYALIGGAVVIIGRRLSV